MDLEFWKQRWDARQIGFHEGKPNLLLASHMERFAGRKRVLVPLAGKAVDLLLLRAHGMEVVGVEAVEAPCRELFTDNGLSYRVEGNRFIGDGITMVCADFFALDDIGRFDAVYDRAALVAVDPDERTRYVDTIAARLEADAHMLLVTFQYDQSKLSGPPWSVDERTVRQLYPGNRGNTVERILTHEVDRMPKLIDAGVAHVYESLFSIRTIRSSRRA